MNSALRKDTLRRIIWDYNIPTDDIEDVLSGHKKSAGHYTREKLFLKLIETYPWFTIIQIFSPEEVKGLLTDQVILQLRSSALRKKYEFVQKRLHQIIPVSG